jgi:lipid A 3-O-deacylase
MTIFLRLAIVAGLLGLGAALSGGAVARDATMPRDVLLRIAEAGDIANRAESRAATRDLERRAVATRLSASVISALALYPRQAGVILRTAMGTSPRHRDYIAEKVAAVFPGYSQLAWREANSTATLIPKNPLLMRVATVQTEPVLSNASPAMEPPKSHEEFGISAVVLGFGGHDVGAFGHRKESGRDFNAEIRFTPFDGWLWDFILSPEPHIGAHYNSVGNTSQVFVGGTWMFDLGWDIFAGGSLGFALHDGETDTDKLDRKELGLPVLFRESAELGYSFTDHHAISLHLDHISNASITENNEGLDTFGLRYTYRL